MHRSSFSRFGSLKARLPYSGPGQRIGLMGGTFNPPHDGHRLISQIAIKRLQLDRLWWLVTPGNPLKDHQQLPPLDIRLRQCRDFIGSAAIDVTDFEQHLNTPFTAATLEYLRQRRSTTRFIWIMGADNLANFHHWRHWRRIIALMPIAIVNRPGWHLRGLASIAAITNTKYRLPEARAAGLPTMRPPAMTLLTGPLSNYSSTAIRQTAKTAIPSSNGRIDTGRAGSGHSKN